MATRRSGTTVIQQSRALAPGQKALYHSVFGAGKSKVIRDFFDIGDDDVAAIVAEAQRRITKNLQSQGER